MKDIPPEFSAIVTREFWNLINKEASMSEANKKQVGGVHYKRGEQEHWDRVVALGLDYFQAQVTKYVERCWEKNGVQDLEKALHFIEKYIEVSRAAGRKGKMEARRVGVMDHLGNAQFTMEGITGDRVGYQCRHCREHFHVALDQLPIDVHLCPQHPQHPQHPQAVRPS